MKEVIQRIFWIMVLSPLSKSLRGEPPNSEICLNSRESVSDGNKINKVRILSYNCRGLKNMVISNALEQCDIMLLQETWIYKQEHDTLNSISDHFYGTGVSPNDSSLGIAAGRPFCGSDQSINMYM